MESGGKHLQLVHSTGMLELLQRTKLCCRCFPTLHPGDVVILDNLNTHKSPRAAATLAARGAWFLFLPKYSPDLNPIEMAFSKLKAHLRKAAARTYDALWKAAGNICNLFTAQECWNFFKEQNYVAD